VHEVGGGGGVHGLHCGDCEGGGGGGRQGGGDEEGGGNVRGADYVHDGGWGSWGEGCVGVSAGAEGPMSARQGALVTGSRDGSIALWHIFSP